MKPKIFNKLKKFTIGTLAMTMAVMQPVGVLPDNSVFHTVVTAEAATVKKTPGKVTLGTVKAAAYNKITISWKKTTNATHYRVYYKVPGGSWKQITTVASNKTSYTHTSSKKFPIIVGQKYTYTVRAYNSSSKKLGSYNTKGLTTNTLPATVKLKKAALNSKKTAITVTWNKAAGGNYYYVYRKSTSNPNWKKIATVKSSVLSYTDKNPVKGEKNTYTVRAYYSKTKVLGGYNKTGVSATMPAVKVTKVALNKTSATLTKKGQTVTLSASVSPSNATNKTVTWTSSNTKVATVSGGKVTAVANGTATITATAKDGSKKKATCKITVKIPAPVVKVTSVTLNQTSASLTKKGQTVTLSATVAPSNASNKSITWTSSNANVATVNNGVVTAVANGTATITATAADGSGKSASCKITVNIPAPVITVTGVSLNKTSAVLTTKGQTVTLSATVQPSNAANKNVTWATSNANVATVNNGVVTAVANGTCTITVTTADGNKKASCTITVDIPAPTPQPVKVSSVSLNTSSVSLTAKGQTTQLTATVSPSNADNKSLTWSTSNSSVATVSNGKITAVANGTCTITATAADGSGKSASCSVTVKIPEPTVDPTPSATNVSLAGGKSKICSIFPEDVTANVNLKEITYEFRGNTSCIDIAGAGYAELNQSSRATIQGLKTGTVQIIAKYNNSVLKIWNVTVTSNWDVYVAYENWKHGVESQIWNSNMSDIQKLNAIRNYIQSNFHYGSGSGASNKYYAYQNMIADCYGAAGMFGDMASDLGATVGYVSKATGQVYEYMSGAVGAAAGHVYTVVQINGQWVNYDSTPPY